MNSRKKLHFPFNFLKSFSVTYNYFSFKEKMFAIDH